MTDLCDAGPSIIQLPASASGQDIQLALDLVSKSGEVRLPSGRFEIRQPIFLRKDDATLRGAGASTVVFLADQANCPVLVMGAPLTLPSRSTARLLVSDLVIDGNRERQQVEFWRSATDGSELNNNGIDVWNVADASISNVVCHSCRSGGLVTAGNTRRLTVRDFTAFDNQFDGLACYETEDSRFTTLFLHDNLGAGISLDLEFNNNRIDHAKLNHNDLGVFMRHSRRNTFEDIRIQDSRHHGVFMAQALGCTANGWGLAPSTECTDNRFRRIDINHCGGTAFLVNDISCTNNLVSDYHFADNAMDQVTTPVAKPLAASVLAPVSSRRAEAMPTAVSVKGARSGSPVL